MNSKFAIARTGLAGLPNRLLEKCALEVFHCPKWKRPAPLLAFGAFARDAKAFTGYFKSKGGVGTKVWVHGDILGETDRSLEDDLQFSWAISSSSFTESPNVSLNLPCSRMKCWVEA